MQGLLRGYVLKACYYVQGSLDPIYTILFNPHDNPPLYRLGNRLFNSPEVTQAVRSRDIIWFHVHSELNGDPSTCSPCPNPQNL